MSIWLIVPIEIIYAAEIGKSTDVEYIRSNHILRAHSYNAQSNTWPEYLAESQQLDKNGYLF